MIDYKVLSDNELIKLSKNDALALTQLFNNYDKMMKSITRSCFLTDGDKFDLQQEAMIGLFNAINTYNLDGNTMFSTYAYTCMKNAVKTAVNRAKNNKNKPLSNFISLSGNDDEDIDKNVIICDFNSNPEDDFINRESKDELINNIRSNLSKLEQDILFYYLKGYSYVDIGEKTKKNVKSIDNAIQRIRKKLKKVIENRRRN